MSINRITVQQEDGTELAVLSSAFIIAAVDNYDVDRVEYIDAECSSTSVALSSPGYQDSFLQAYSELLDDRYVSTINGVTCTADSNFFIHGSACDSIEMDDQYSTLKITDLCPACSTCNDEAKLWNSIHDLIVWINELKDVNMYTKDVLDERSKKLKEVLATELGNEYKSAACGTSNTNTGLIKSELFNCYRMFQQYITLVHMWNYAVSINSSAVAIQTTPETTGGAAVQVKKAIPYCSTSNTTVKCIIRFEPYPTDQKPTQENLSVYVSSPTLDCAPFNQKETYGTPTINIYQGTALQTFDTSITDLCTTKVVELQPTVVQYASTWTLSVKFLPFIYTTGGYSTSSAHKYRSASGGFIYYASDKQPLDANDRYLGYETKRSYTGSIKQLNAPTLDNYNNGFSYPSKQAAGQNMWKITTTWIIKQGENTTTTNETYYFSSAYVRSLDA